MTTARRIVLIIAIILLALLGIPLISAAIIYLRSGYIDLYFHSDSVVLTSFVIPNWMSISTFVAWCCYFVLRKKTKTRKHDHCLTCNYNLTGNVSGRCPDCNAPVHVSDAALVPERPNSKLSRAEKLLIAPFLLLALVIYAIIMLNAAGLTNY